MSKSCFYKKIPKSRDCPWDSSPKQSQEFWLSQSRPMGHKSLGLLGLAVPSNAHPCLRVDFKNLVTLILL